LTGLDRSDTDKIIRRYLGTVDDFMLTSVATQFSAQSFISEGSTNRKAILAKFLDLDIFEAKFKVAKSESAEIKALLKKLDNVDYDTEIKSTKDLIKQSEETISSTTQLISSLQANLNSKKEELFSTQSEIKQIVIEEESIAECTLEKINLLNDKNALLQKVEELKVKLAEHNDKLLALSDDLAIKIEEMLEKKASYDASNKTIEQLRSEYKLAQANNGVLARQASVLKEVPCGSEYSHCKFIKDAYKAEADKPQSDKKLVQITLRFL